jgi:adenine-specific DNA-methyltransferase
MASILKGQRNMARKAKSAQAKSVETLTHSRATRKNIPSAEHQAVMRPEEQNPVRVVYERRNRDLDPQLVWRGKDEQDWSDLVVHAPPLYIQERIHPQALIDDLLKESRSGQPRQMNLFADFNGLPEGADKTEFYQHEGRWQNRMILGDNLQVMASLAEREGLRGKVQCIYLDPPYGIKFNSNFQWSTASRDVKDGNPAHITREPEQVKAFRDTWRDGIHSYLTYLRDRLTAARDLLTDSGSIFVQIGDENLHRVRCVLDEVFGEENFVVTIEFQKTGSLTGKLISSTVDYLIWYAKKKNEVKFRQLFRFRESGTTALDRYDYVENIDKKHLVRIPAAAVRGELPLPEGKRCRLTTLLSDGVPSEKKVFIFENKKYILRHGKHWKTDPESGGIRLIKANRIVNQGETVWYKRFVEDFPVLPINDRWESVQIGRELTYVVQTAPEVIQRCILMATDPGDLVLDPTCGSGTTAYVAEQWGRRWITIDTSRVALALARARIMGGRYPFYLLADSPEGQRKEAELARTVPSAASASGRIRHGFVYERVPHITLKSIANNAEIDVIWDRFQEKLEPLRLRLNQMLEKNWQEWEIPRQTEEQWPSAAQELHSEWWRLRSERQQEIDASIAAKADCEYLYDKPYEDKKKVRVAGPFTVESLLPHRMLAPEDDEELTSPVLAQAADSQQESVDFVQMILEHLRTAGVQQAHREDRISFTSLTPWPGELVCAEGRYDESGSEKRAAVFIGPEFGTVSRSDLAAAAREAGEAGFDVLIACAFNYDALSADFSKLGRVPVLKARMNADLQMADDLKNTGQGNLFVVFGEPDIDILDAGGGKMQVKIKGVDIFRPNTGEVVSSNADGIACWFIDTDYDEESFFVRQAYFLGADDPCKALKTTLKAEINEEVWASLRSDTSRPFAKPATGRIAVKVINHLGDEVMKVFRV